MRLAHVSDLHVTEGPGLDDQAAILERVADQIDELQVRAVLLTGDFYGRTVPHRSTPRERRVMFRFVARLAAWRPVLILYGNHDYPDDLEPLAELAGQWPVKVIAGASHGEVRTPDGGALHYYGLPYPTKRWLLAGEEVAPGLEESRQAIGAKLDALLGLWRTVVADQRARNPGAVQVVLAHALVTGAHASGGEVLAAQEIELNRTSLAELGADYVALGHLHARQELAPRVWYAGSTWRNSFAETEDKGWSLVCTGVEGDGGWSLVTGVEGDGPVGSARFLAEYPPGFPARARGVSVWGVATSARARVTLDWRWAADTENGEPRWVTQPSVAELAGLAGAEVRARLVVPQQHVAGCPWDQVLADLEELGAHRVVSERTIEPVLRTRAPEALRVAKTPAEKLGAYWTTLATELEATEKSAALEALADLSTLTDEDLAADAAALLKAEP